MEKQENIQSVLVHLFQEGSISLPVALISEYKQVGLSEQEVMLLIHILVYQEKAGQPLPSIEEIGTRMSLSTEKIAGMFNKLTRNGCLDIEEEINEYGMRCERYSIAPLYQKLAAARIKRNAVEPKTNQYQSLFHLFEQEFGRPLSPFECEQLSHWIDQDGYADELIEAALREAVFSGKVSFRYIDRILLDWQRNGIQTAEDAIEYAKRFRQKGVLYQSLSMDTGKSKQKMEKKAFSFYNWVNQE